MAIKNRVKTEKGFDEINITSLIDILCVILFSFMISAQFVVQSNIKVELPQVRTKEKANQTDVEVVVDKEGKMYLGNTQYNDQTLPVYLKKLSSDKNTNQVIIKADENTRYEAVMSAIDICRSSGLDNLTLATKLTTDATEAPGASSSTEGGGGGGDGGTTDTP